MRLQVLTVASMMISSEILRLVVWQKITDVSEVLAASIIKTFQRCADDEKSKHV
jgi:hypothetical protein